MFDETQLIEPSDFSVDATATHGLVHATYLGHTGPIPIMLDAVSGIWVPDLGPMRQALPKAYDGGHMAADGDVYAWIDGGGGMPSELRSSHFVSPAVGWTTSALPLAFDSNRDLRAGNAIVLDAGGGATITFLPEVSLARDGVGAASITILSLEPLAATFVATHQGDTLDAADTLDISQAVITQDHAYLVYAASVAGAPSRFFVSLRKKDKYPVGDPVLFRQGVDGALTQPWIDATCSTLYFRRDNKTWMAKTMDESASGQ
jgi:hypothetical protein